MKRTIITIFTIIITTNIMAQQKINVKVGSRTFTATLLDNETAREFVNRLPVTLSMRDVNSNEKYAEFSQSFPGTRKVAGNIKAGDLKIWSGNGLVLFYDKINNSPYSYYDLGSIDDATGLREALGSGTVSITFALQTTGINTVNAEKSKANGVAYTLSGTPVAKSAAKGGIFIVDGKKVQL